MPRDLSTQFLKCPECGGTQFRVRCTWGRHREPGVRLRRRICRQCGYPILTEERVVPEQPAVEHMVPKAGYFQMAEVARLKATPPALSHRCDSCGEGRPSSES
jgi:transcriptional regulator NrdR family protein